MHTARSGILNGYFRPPTLIHPTKLIVGIGHRYLYKKGDYQYLKADAILTQRSDLRANGNFGMGEEISHAEDVHQPTPITPPLLRVKKKIRRERVLILPIQHLDLTVVMVKGKDFSYQMEYDSTLFLHINGEWWSCGEYLPGPESWVWRHHSSQPRNDGEE